MRWALTTMPDRWGLAATTAIFTVTWKQGCILAMAKVPAGVSSQCDALTKEFSTFNLAAPQMPSRNKCA
jgi:hypothetical protein